MASKTAMITIVGRPNVGKSTLTNRLVGEKVAIVSHKPQTTRNRICGIVNRADTQFIFVDTPGFHKPRTKLGDYMVNVTRQSVSDVDAVILMVEPIAHVGRQEEALLNQLRQAGEPVILAINKIDTVEKDALLSVIARYHKELEFAAVVPICAKSGDGIEELLAECSRFAQEGPHLFPEDATSDQPERQMMAEIIRESFCGAWSGRFPMARRWRSPDFLSGTTVSLIWTLPYTVKKPATRALSSANRELC